MYILIQNYTHTHRQNECIFPIRQAGDHWKEVSITDLLEYTMVLLLRKTKISGVTCVRGITAGHADESGLLCDSVNSKSIAVFEEEIQGWKLRQKAVKMKKNRVRLLCVCLHFHYASLLFRDGIIFSCLCCNLVLVPISF